MISYITHPQSCSPHDLPTPDSLQSTRLSRPTGKRHVIIPFIRYYYCRPLRHVSALYSLLQVVEGTGSTLRAMCLPQSETNKGTSSVSTLYSHYSGMTVCISRAWSCPLPPDSTLFIRSHLIAAVSPLSHFYSDYTWLPLISLLPPRWIYGQFPIAHRPQPSSSIWSRALFRVFTCHM